VSLMLCAWWHEGGDVRHAEPSAHCGLLIDLRMPAGGDVVAIGTIRRALPSAKVVLIMVTPQLVRVFREWSGQTAGAFRKLNAPPPYDPRNRK
jgi:hypothetical protein